MTATDELRLPNGTKELDTLLNERGKEHRVWPSGLVIWHDEGSWVYEYNPPKGDDDYWGGILHATLRHCTPEQAIEATLGRGTTTRHGKFRTKYGRSVPCCECCGYGIGDERWHYCPSCGAEVVE